MPLNDTDNYEPRRYSTSVDSRRSPTKLRWDGSCSNPRSCVPLDILQPTKKYLARVSTLIEEKPRSLNFDSHVLRGTRQLESLRPAVQHALLLIHAEEIRHRTLLKNQETSAFLNVMDLFGFAQVQEAIRRAAFQLFKLEERSRQIIFAHERSDRSTLVYWMQENYQDAKVSEHLRDLSVKDTASRDNTISTTKRSSFLMPDCQSVAPCSRSEPSCEYSLNNAIVGNAISNKSVSSNTMNNSYLSGESPKSYRIDASPYNNQSDTTHPLLKRQDALGRKIQRQRNQMHELMTSTDGGVFRDPIINRSSRDYSEMRSDSVAAIRDRFAALLNNAQY